VQTVESVMPYWLAEVGGGREKPAAAARQQASQNQPML